MEIALIVSRLLAALFSNIQDCDETFNYLEPLHFMIYGHGLQTWEYVYRLRSWAYIALHSVPIRILQLFTLDKIYIFYGFRVALSMISATFEIMLVRSVKDLDYNIGNTLNLLLISSPGMYISSSCTLYLTVAFLPSSFAMYFCTLAYALSLRDPLRFSSLLLRIKTICLSFGVACLWGWPFSAVLGILFAAPALFTSEGLKHVFWSFISTILLVLLPLVAIDSFFYNRLTIAPLNLVLYNIFSDAGPDLYGTEPWYFYFLNGFLNFNIAFPLALISLPALMLSPIKKHFNTFLVALIPCYVWLLIFTMQPHKEERFLYPIFPLILLNASVALTSILATVKRVAPFANTKILLKCAVALFTGLSMLRIAALYQYHAMMEIYTLIPANATNVCVGQEWYRFPSHFLLQGSTTKLKFIRAGFDGLLPTPFGEGYNSGPEFINDVNTGLDDRYSALEECEFLIDIGPREAFKEVACRSLLDASRTPQLSRAFYLGHREYFNYCVYLNEARSSVDAESHTT